jgi:hypothetical protein
MVFKKSMLYQLFFGITLRGMIQPIVISISRNLGNSAKQSNGKLIG